MFFHLWGWPLITLVIFFTLLICYRGRIGELITRIRAGSGFGLKVELDGRKDAQLPVASEKDPIGVEESEIEKYIKENPKQVLAEYLKMRNTAHFERCFNLIFGSQVRLLEFLEKSGSTGAKYVDLVPFYSHFAQSVGNTTTQLAEYLGFLINYCSFIEYENLSGKELEVKLTPYGADFLSYIRIQYKGTYFNKGL